MRHAGLQLDKLSAAGAMQRQKDALMDVTRTVTDQKLLRTLLDRRRLMLDALRATRLEMTTRGSLTLHLSRSGALENAGIALHPLYGFVYLPGSGVKGMTRAWAETAWAPTQPDSERAWRQIEAAFGWSPRSEGHKSVWRPSDVAPPPGATAGRVLFHDAWPLRWPRLLVDVVNNHHVSYYAGEDDPGDWEEPTLISFLAVGADQPFEFAISDRTGAEDGLLERAGDWLRDALTVQGAGAKTAAGYGRFEPARSDRPVTVPAHVASFTCEMKLITPAFLAGADQQEEDCDLRPATLRGLLRWWWRTMHASHLDRDSLRRLETAVWGDAQSGSPVHIAVDFMQGGAPERHPDKRDPQFRSAHGLRRPSNGKVIQGLFYASYGMAEKNWRWFRPPGSTWRVTLTAKSGRLGSGKHSVSLSAERLLQQATAALWLLARFGGAGSRARKGFGSFDEIAVPELGSIEDCKAAAGRFRETCRLDPRRGRPAEASALEDALLLEHPTQWHDPWYALDRTGAILQRFAKQLDTERRIALGLPRRIGCGSNAPSLSLSTDTGIRRHAAPALWSLANGPNGTLTVRLIGFPAARLPDKKRSRATLSEFLRFAKDELAEEAQRVPRRQPPRRSDASINARSAYVSPPTRTGLPRANDRVQAEILEEKTRKGGWRARHLDSGLEGAIQDTQSVPAEMRAGQVVELTVAWVNEHGVAFKWAEPAKRRQPRARKARP